MEDISACFALKSLKIPKNVLNTSERITFVKTRELKLGVNLTFLNYIFVFRPYVCPVCPYKSSIEINFASHYVEVSILNVKGFSGYFYTNSES